MTTHGSLARAALVLGAATQLGACWRLGVTLKENDASGHEVLGVPVIEAIEYTPLGRDVRVKLEQPGYVTVLVVDPARSVSVRFARGESRSRHADSLLVRLPLDRLESPMRGIPVATATLASRPRPRRPVAMPGASGVVTQRGVFDMASPLRPPPDIAGGDTLEAGQEQRLRSMRVQGNGPVSRPHVVVLLTEHPLDLVGVATRIAMAPAIPAIVAQAAAGDGTEGGRWIAASAPIP